VTLYGLHAHDLDPRRVTGIARYALGLADALQPRLEPQEYAALVTARDCGTVQIPHKVIDRRRRDLYASWMLTGRPRVERLLPELDLIHLTAPILPVATRLPVVATIHDITPLTHPEWYPRRDVLGFRLALAWTKRHARAVIVPTAAIGQQVHERLGILADRLHVTGYGFDPDHFSANSDPGTLSQLGLEDKAYVVYLGAISTRKNIATLIEALVPGGPELVLAGPDGFGAESIRSAAAAAVAAGKRVRVLGRLDEGQIGPLLKGAIALVHPSLFEGFGLTVLEAMGCGTPVLVSSMGSLPEVVGDGGLIVRSNDAAGWREALGVVDDAAELVRLREVGLRRSLDWSWAKTADGTLEVYRRAMG
jgi:glycosyltransferase involved in cell wall biosynthesis